jgi:hypothetical protein
MCYKKWVSCDDLGATALAGVPPGTEESLHLQRCRSWLPQHDYLDAFIEERGMHDCRYAIQA